MRQKWLSERASILRSTYIACPAMFCATENNFITYSTRTVAIRVAERSNLRLMLLNLQYAISFRLARYINTAATY